MAKFTPKNLNSGFADTDSLNENFTALATFSDTVLSRDGTSPNTMEASLDMNSKKIINLPDAVSAQEPATFSQLLNISDTSGFVGTVSEVQVATAGQTAFTLALVTYTPGVDNISVYVNGVYLPADLYTQTSSTVVTLSTGLIVGQRVAFVINQRNIDATTTPATSVTYVPAGASAVITNVQAKLRESVSIMDFGADPTGTVDSTAAIQAAIDFAGANQKTVHLNDGTYLFSQLIVPRNSSLIGNGARGTTELNPTLTGTVLKQISGSEKDGIIFEKQAGGDDNVSSILLQGFQLLGPDTISTASNNGILSKDVLGASVNFAGVVIFDDLWIRFWKGDGINLGVSRLSNFLIQSTSCRDNGGYGINIVGGSIVQATTFRQITLEGNSLGGVHLGRIGSERQLLIDTIYVEGGGTAGYAFDNFGSNPDTGTTSPYAIVVKGKAPGARNAGLSVRNGVALKAQSSLQAFIFNDPEAGDDSYPITWDNITNEIGGLTGDANIFEDTDTLEVIGPTFQTGQWMPSGTSLTADQNNMRLKGFTAVPILPVYHKLAKICSIGLTSSTEGGLLDDDNAGAYVVDTTGNATIENTVIIRPSKATASPRLDPASDGTIRFGGASARWSELFASNGTINTSDANKKQQVRDLNESEKNVAIAIKGLIKSFKFNDAVAKKGDGARIHVGVIAQEVRDAFTDEGLDAHDYSLFCSDTWWTDSSGKIYEEDGEGLEEHTLLGIRYEQLLAFVISSL